MTADRFIPSYRLVLRALLTATRTTVIAVLIACLLRMPGTKDLSWSSLGLVVWNLRWLVGAVFAFCLLWDFGRHVMDPHGREKDGGDRPL